MHLARFSVVFVKNRGPRNKALLMLLYLVLLNTPNKAILIPAGGLSAGWVEQGSALLCGGLEKCWGGHTAACTPPPPMHPFAQTRLISDALSVAGGSGQPTCCSPHWPVHSWGLTRTIRGSTSQGCLKLCKNNEEHECRLWGDTTVLLSPDWPEGSYMPPTN